MTAALFGDITENRHRGRCSGEHGAMPRGLRLDAPGVLHHRNVERCLDSSVQLLDFGSVAGTHEPLQSIARHGEHVIEDRHARNRQPLSSAESHFRRELAHRSGYKGYHDAADGVEYSVAGQDHNGSSTGKCGQFSSPHFSPFHAWPAFHNWDALRSAHLDAHAMRKRAS